MYENILCVGGILDGSKRSSKLETFTVAGAYRPQDRAATAYHYGLMIIETAQVKHLVFRDLGLAPEQVLEKLLEHYKPYA